MLALPAMYQERLYMKKLLQTIVLITFWTSVFGQELHSRRKFNGILIGQGKHILSPTRLDYKHKFKKKLNDSIIYSFEFQDVEGIGTPDTAEMRIVRDKIYIGPYFDGDNEFEKLMDFGIKVGQQWTARNLFCFNNSTITFETKYFDNIAKDTLYQFRVDGKGLCSHTDRVTRIYGSRKLGLVRLDYSLPPSSFQTNIYGRAIFVSDDYIRRRKLNSLYKGGLIKIPR